MIFVGFFSSKTIFLKRAWPGVSYVLRCLLPAVLNISPGQTRPDPLPSLGSVGGEVIRPESSGTEPGARADRAGAPTQGGRGEGALSYQ